MTIQEKLAQRIYELLPHKKELEFGTAWEDEQAKWVYIDRYSITTSQKGGWTSVPPEKSQIIGQPLRLADLLMAIEKVLNDNHICYVNSVGAVYILDMNKSYQKQFEDTNYGEYNLSKDNILDQSDEFCEFVLELLK